MNVPQNSWKLAALFVGWSMSQASAQDTQQMPGVIASRDKVEASSLALLNRHLTSFQKKDLNALMEDYTNESVFITQAATYKGIEEIKGFFTDLMGYFPPQGSSFTLDKTIVSDDLIYIVWHAKTPRIDIPLGSDTFIIKDGKISRQTFVKSSLP
jgi:hypothetical protein